MNQIPCVIPMKDGHVLRREVYASLALQTVPLAIMPVTRPPLQEEERVSHKSNHKSQAATRNIGVEILEKSCLADFSVWHVSDVVLNKNDAIEQCLQVLKMNDKIGAVYINTSMVPIATMENICHFELTCAVVRNAVFRTIRFRSQNGHCNCTSFAKDMVAAGWIARFLSEEVMGHKISRYDVSEL